MRATFLKRTLLTLFISFFIANCTTDTLETFEEKATTENNLQKRESNQQEVAPPEYAKNELIIKYAKHVTTERQKAEIRKRNGVESFETCDCENNEGYEAWNFGDEDVDIEDKLSGSRDDPGLDGAGFQYLIQLFNEINTHAEADIDRLRGLVKPESNEAGVTIAILDSGLDYTYNKFQRPFLYNNSEDINNCNGEQLISGWDFVNNDNDVMDDNGHGTAITYITYNNMINSGVQTNFQILPVKVFDLDGTGKLFNIYCGLKFAEEKGANVIKMSFGWYKKNFQLIDNQIKNTPHILYVASAGNDGKDVDSNGSDHYPSNITYDNMLSVAGVEGTWLHGIWGNSNYGSTSIDVAAPSDNFSFDYLGNNYSLSGTSYAVPLVTSKASQLFGQYGNSVSNLKQQTINSGAYEINLTAAGPYGVDITVYPKVISGLLY